jgi:Domain of unknown function (DUF4411)
MELFHPKYIFDSGPFIDLKNYPGDVFSSLWENFMQMINDGEIISSSEVFRELEDYDDEIAAWAKLNKNVFIKPTLEEQVQVQKILEKHPDLVKEEAILLGKPYADPFVIAQAKMHNCVLVHSEKFKPNAHKIPNVCSTFKVEETNLFDFFRREKWKF